MKAKRQIESSLNSGTMLDGTGGHVNCSIETDNLRTRAPAATEGVRPQRRIYFSNGLPIPRRSTGGECSRNCSCKFHKIPHRSTRSVL